MIDKLNEEIEQVNSNIDVLPTNNKRNIVKYNEYIDECLAKYNSLLKETEDEINSRNDNVLSKYKDLTYDIQNTELNYSAFVLSDMRSTSSEKMNLEYQFYKLKQSGVNNLSEVNEIINNIIKSFQEAGVELTEKDFNYSDAVSSYIYELFTHDNNIQDVFNNIFWKTPDIIKQLILNIRYLYYKNVKKLDKYYKDRYSEFNYHEFIKKHRGKIEQNEKNKHGSVKYIYDLFINKELVLDDFIDENKVNELKKSLLENTESIRNYENLVSLTRSLQELKGYRYFEYIITDFKELYTHKAEFKDLFNNKLKDISKVESKLLGLNKKINKKGLFKLKDSKLSDTIVERNALFTELENLYTELDELKIKETINRYVTSKTNYYDALKLTSYNFDYFIKLLEKHEVEVNVENIDNEMQKLYKFIYDNNIDLINNIVLSEDKNVAKIISEMYILNGVLVDEAKMEAETLDKLIENVYKLLICYDIKNLDINLNDFKFLLDVKDVLG